MKKIILTGITTLTIIGIVSAQLNIQTNLENAVQTIKKVFITSDGLANNPGNTLVSINGDNDGTVFIKNKLETNGVVKFQALNNNPTPTDVVSIQADGTLTKTNINNLASGSNQQRQESPTVLSTNKKVAITPGITASGDFDMFADFYVKGRSIIGGVSEQIYIFPDNQIPSGSSIGGITSLNGNLKINTKSSGGLFLNFDVSGASTRIKGHTSIGEGEAPTATLDIQASNSNGHSQLRLRQSYTPSAFLDPSGATGSIARDDNYIYIKTNQGRKRALLSPVPTPGS